jgi:cobalt-precorrin 5A hydrolase
MNTEQKNNMPTTAIWTITKSGYAHGRNLASKIDNSILFVSENLLQKLNGLKKMDRSFCKNPLVFSNLSEKTKQVFMDFDAHIFIFSTGIAVRMIAPLIKSKTKDPAVVVLDDNAKHSISLLSGHIGGANELAEKVALLTKAKPVITTATDVHNKPAIDTIAIKNNLHILNTETIKKINMAILEGKAVKIEDPFNIIADKVPNSVCVQKKPDIICTDNEIHVPRGTLVLNPSSLFVGIGCNRGTPMDEIESFLLETLKENKLSIKSIVAFASIEEKKDETGFLELSKKHAIRFYFINKEELDSVKNIKNPSKIVQKHMGVKSVCEAAAIKAGGNATLIVQKQIKGNVTIAIARKKQFSI